MRRFIWRLCLFNIVASYPYWWSWPSAWEYAKSMAETYFDDDPDGWRDPSDALAEDMSYW